LIAPPLVEFNISSRKLCCRTNHQKSYKLIVPKACYFKSSESDFKIFRASKTSPKKILVTFKKRRILSLLELRLVILDLHCSDGGLSSFQGW
jgi:hypothetical protein